MAQQQLNLSAIQALCSPAMQSKIDKMAGGKGSGYGAAEKRVDYGYDDPMLGGMMTEETQNENYNIPEIDETEYNNRLASMNLPESIRKSLQEQKAVLQTASPKEGDAIEQMLGNMGISRQRQQQLANVQRPLGEATDYQAYTSPSWPKSTLQRQPSVGIDYETLRLVINDCLDKKLATMSDIILKDKKIRIIDNKGNIYSAELKKEGNINNK